MQHETVNWMTNIIAFFSNDKFYHSDEENASVYMLINRHDCPDIEQKAERIKQMFFDRGFNM